MLPGRDARSCRESVLQSKLNCQGAHALQTTRPSVKLGPPATSRANGSLQQLCTTPTLVVCINSPQLALIPTITTSTEVDASTD